MSNASSSRSAEDSLLALQALLQIRSNRGQGEELSAVSASASHLDPRLQGSNTGTSAGIESLLRMTAAAAPESLLRAQLNYSPAQLAALHAAAVAAIPGAYTSNVGLLSAFASPAALAGASLQAQSLLRPIAPTDVASLPRPTTNSPPPPHQVQVKAHTAHLSASGDASTSSANGSADSAAEAAADADALIRKEEVEAALKSKPQRGRKRENLNVLERLELTRTRNREHAKSTRVRKKQRYQELVDNEQKLLDMQKLEETKAERRLAFLKLMRVREAMLCKLLAERWPGCSSSKGTGGEQKPESNGKLRARYDDSKMDSSSPRAEPVEANAPPPIVTPMKSETGSGETAGVVDEQHSLLVGLSNFEFDSFVGGNEAGRDEMNGYEAMSRFDRNIASCIKRMVGSPREILLSFRVVGSSEGVAVSKNGMAFANVELLLGRSIDGDSRCPIAALAALPKKVGTQAKVVLSSIVSVHFAPGTTKISKVQWSVLKDFLSVSCPPNGEARNLDDTKASDSLDSQIVYPSVVSLDPALHGEGAGELKVSVASNHAGEDQPGMNL